MWPLRQSTASQEIPLGPFLDSGDGNTQETALSIANTDIKIMKAGGTSEASKNSGGATHIASGRYYAVLDATDTDTIGPLRVSVHVSGALAVWLDCMVWDEALYDFWFGTSAPAPASDATAIKAVTDALGATAAARLNLSALQIIPGTVDTVVNSHTPTTTEFQADNITEATADHYNGRIVIFTSGGLTGQATSISDYLAVGGIGQFTVVALTEAPANNDTFIIL